MEHGTNESELVSLAFVPALAGEAPASAGLPQMPPPFQIVPAKIRPPRASGLRRRRLEEALEAGLWERRMGVIVAPAGAGKTTLLAQFDAALGAPSAWYRAEGSDGDAGVLIRYLEATLTRVLPRLRGGWACVEDAAAALERCPETRALLVVDDLHLLRGTPAEAMFERLLSYRPPSLAILAASRTTPDFKLLSRLRLAGELLELAAEDLRFRSWEVERLFSEHYGRPLPPEEAGELARRTEGWAAGLQMFHLGTTGKTPTERRRTLAALGVRSKLAREYLARNVLEDLPVHLRTFLLATCVLGWLSGSLCDQLLGVSGSEANLADLERRHVFTYALDAGGYRYHEALRAHLEGVLLEEVGPETARQRYRRAAQLLEASGASTDALQAYCRAEDWGSVGRLLGREGESLAVGSSDWIHLLPPSLSAHDPWVLLATARRHRACGRWKEALQAYRAAEDGFGAQSGVESAASERLALASWLEPGPPSTDWWGTIRAAAASHPLVAAARAASMPGAHSQLGAGLASLLGGEISQARAALAAAARSEDASQALLTGALLAGAVAAALAGDPAGKAEAELASKQAEALGLPWLGRLGQAVLALTDRPDGRSEAAAVKLFCTSQGDVWGACLAGLLEGLGELLAGGNRTGSLDEAAAGFARLGAPTLETWCLCVRAGILANGNDPGARAVAEVAERRARIAGLQAPWALAYLALGRTDPTRRPEIEAWAHQLARDCGLALPATAGANGRAADGEVPPGLRVRCFGGFRMTVGPDAVDPLGIKPRARKLLHLMALNVDRPIHKEVLIEALWPEAEPEVGARNLHVALSSLRQFLQSDPCCDALHIAREGDDYRLVPAAGAEIDVVEFSALLEQGRRLQATGEVDDAIAALTQALALHAGDLLPEDGPDDWVVRDRESFRAGAVEAARVLAELLLAEGDPIGATRACERGLDIDRHRDDLWRALQRAHAAAGNYAAAEGTRRRYEQVLAELGIGPEQVSGHAP